MVEKFIIDTDIGDDIDDAFAIQYALNAGLAVVGIATVFRSAFLRAELTAYMLDCMGRADVPVYAGEDIPILEPIDAVQKPERNLCARELAEVRATGRKWLPHYLAEAAGHAVQPKHAVDFIIECAAKYGDRLGIFCIGPLTNIARAIEKAPDVMRKVGELYIMGGDFTSDTPEWNVRLDPEAARTVFAWPVPKTVVGADRTWKHTRVRQDELVKLRSMRGAIGRLNVQMLDRWGEQPIYMGKLPVMHDSLVVAAVATDCLRLEERSVRVGTDGEERAKTLFAPDGAAAKICVDVDEEKFRASMWKHIFGKEADGASDGRQ